MSKVITSLTLFQPTSLNVIVIVFTGSPTVQSPPRNPLLDDRHLGPVFVPTLRRSQAQEASARRRQLHVDRLQVRGDVRAGDQRLRLHHRFEVYALGRTERHLNVFYVGR